MKNIPSEQTKINKALKTYREYFDMYRRVGLGKMEADIATRASMGDWCPELDIDKVFPMPSTTLAISENARLEAKLLRMISVNDGIGTGILVNKCRSSSKEEVEKTLEIMVKKGKIITSETVHPANMRPVVRYHSAGVRRVK